MSLEPEEPDGTPHDLSDSEIRFQALLDQAIEKLHSSEDDYVLGVVWAFRVFRGHWLFVVSMLIRRMGRSHEPSAADVVDPVDAAVVAAWGASEAPEPNPITEQRAESTQDAPQPEPEKAEEQAVPADGAVSANEQQQRYERFLERIRKEHKVRDKALDIDLRRLRGLQSIVDVFLIAAAAIALLLAIAGAVLIFTGSAAAGAVTTAVALVPGSGAAILFKLRQSLTADRVRKEDQRRRSGDQLELAQLALMDSPNRDDLISKYAGELLSNVSRRDDLEPKARGRRT
jgi:hypothetical protein